MLDTEEGRLWTITVQDSTVFDADRGIYLFAGEHLEPVTYAILDQDKSGKMILRGSAVPD